MVPPSETVKLLCVILDKSLTFQKHVNQVLQSCYHHMKALCHIRHCLDDQTASLNAHALISSCLDYANSILIGSPNYVINKLKRIWNSSLIAKPTRSLCFDSCIGYLSKAEFVSSLPPLHTKPFLPTPRNTLLHLSSTTNLSVLFAPLTNTTSSRLNAPPTRSVLAHYLYVSWSAQLWATLLHLYNPTQIERE